VCTQQPKLAPTRVSHSTATHSGLATHAAWHTFNVVALSSLTAPTELMEFNRLHGIHTPDDVVAKLTYISLHYICECYFIFGVLECTILSVTNSIQYRYSLVDYRYLPITNFENCYLAFTILISSDI